MRGLGRGKPKQSSFGSKLELEVRELQPTLLIFLASGIESLLSLRPVTTDLSHGKSILLLRSILMMPDFMQQVRAWTGVRLPWFESQVHRFLAV